MQISGIFSKIKTTIVIGGLCMISTLFVKPTYGLTIYQPAGNAAGDIFYSIKSEFDDDRRTQGDKTSNNNVEIIYSQNFEAPNGLGMGTYKNPSEVTSLNTIGTGYICKTPAEWNDTNLDDNYHDYDSWCTIFDSDGGVAYKCYFGTAEGNFYTTNDISSSCSSKIGCNDYGNDGVGYGLWTYGYGNGIEFKGCVSKCNMTIDAYNREGKTCAKKAISVPPRNCAITETSNWTATKCDCNTGYCTSKQPANPAGNTEDRECITKPSNSTCATPNDTFICNNKYYTSGNQCASCPNPSIYGYSDYDYASDRKPNTNITNCYMYGSYETKDISGTFEFTRDCYYSN